jgi:hypothetical protein
MGMNYTKGGTEGNMGRLQNLGGFMHVCSEVQGFHPRYGSGGFDQLSFYWSLPTV